MHACMLIIDVYQSDQVREWYLIFQSLKLIAVVFLEMRLPLSHQSCIILHIICSSTVCTFYKICMYLYLNTDLLDI